MKRFFKAVSVAALIFCIPIYGTVAYGTVNLPDEVNIIENDNVDLGAFFSAAENKQAQPVGTGNARNQYKSQITALKVFPVKDITVNVTKRRYVAPGGDVFGIKLYTKGVIVVSIDSVITL